MVELLKDLVWNRSFVIGVVIAICVFSKYIFGADNLVEEIGELFIHITTGKDVDFSPESLPTKELSSENELIQKYKEVTKHDENLDTRH